MTTHPHVADGPVRRRPAADWVVVAGCWVVLVAPLVVALAAAMRPRWFPIQDLAQTELRVRDVGGSHTPLVGLAGRIGTFYDPGSHPGPLSFWLLAPVYRLLGGSATALMASVVFLHSVAFGLTLWMALRRGGSALVAATAALVAVLCRYYGPNVFIEPWNPYLPVSWWIVLLFAVWSVLDGDTPMVVLVVVAGSFCAQTHLPYVGLVGGFVALVVAALARHALGARRTLRTDDRSGGRAFLGWVLGALLLGAALWTAPVIDQGWGTGNLSRIRESVASPEEEVVGLAAGTRELLRNLDPAALVYGRRPPEVASTDAIAWPAVVLVGCWALSALAAWRLGVRRTVAHLHVVIATGLVLAVVSVSRVYGLLWFYLFLWAWALAALMILATAWTAVLVARPRLPAWDPGRWRLAAVATSLIVATVAAGSFAFDNRDAEPARTDLSYELGVVTGQLVDRLDDGDVAGGGRSGRYLVRWTDPVTLGSRGWGLVNELERAGYRAGFGASSGVGGTKHRVLGLADASAVVQLVVGDRDIAVWDADAAATRVGYIDARTARQRSGYRDMVKGVQRRLERAGLSEEAAAWERNLFAASLDEDVPADIRADMVDVLDVPAPLAVYVVAASDAT